MSRAAKSNVSEPCSRTSDGRFVKGHRGGPGRPRKVVAAAADALDERVAARAGDLLEMAFRQADEGNTAALKMLLDRVWPVGRSRPLGSVLPEAATVRDLLAVRTTVANALLAGEATVEEAAAIGQLMEAHGRAAVHHDTVQAMANLRREMEDEQAGQ